MSSEIYKLSVRILLVGLLMSNTSAWAKTYRWVDEDGVVHYSDRVPAQHKDHARSVLDQRGLETNRTEAAKTPEEIAREEELKRLKAHEQRLIEAQQEKDRVLLRTFRYEDDIILTRDGKLASVDASIQIIRGNIRRLKQNLEIMQKNAANRERQGQRVSKNYLKKIERTRNQLKDNYASIIHKEQAKEVIRDKHNADLKRFRELKNLNPEIEDPQEQNRRPTLLETVVTCSSKPQCDQLWQTAEAYVREHATTRMQLLAESIIMTAAPLQDEDISITVSRIEEKDVADTRLFMDLQCKESPRGKDFCKTAQVDEIRRGFRVRLSANDASQPLSPETTQVLSGATAPPTAQGEKP